jgi:hypothetical protein
MENVILDDSPLAEYLEGTGPYGCCLYSGNCLQVLQARAEETPVQHLPLRQPHTMRRASHRAGRRRSS